jgi:hypothetical protein
MHRSREIPAYRTSTAGTRAAVATMDGTQPGDPVKAVAAILRALDSDNPPLRLALGRVEAIRAHHARLREDLEAWEPVSTSTALYR